MIKLELEVNEVDEENVADITVLLRAGHSV